MWGYPPPSLDSSLETTSYGFWWHVNRALLACETYQILSAFLPAASLAWNCLFTLLITSGFCKNVISSEKLSPLAPSKVDALLIATLQSFVMAPFVSFLLSTTMNNYLFICWFVSCMSLPLNCRLSESRNPLCPKHTGLVAQMNNELREGAHLWKYSCVSWAELILHLHGHLVVPRQ